MSLSDTLPLQSPPARRLPHLGAALLLGLGLFAAFAPILATVDPARQDYGAILAAPSAAHPFGTDHLGRDMLARLGSALRLSLGLALLSVVTAAIPGTLLGILAAWRGGWTDRGLSTLADMVLALPGLLLVLLVSAVVPGSFLAIYGSISLVLWIEYFRITRASARAILASPAVEASRLLGFRPAYIVWRHLWPELAPVLLTVGAFGAATAIMAVAALGFVSVGLRPPTAELGLMMTELLPYYAEAPFVLVQPILAVFLLVLALNLVAGYRPR
ncbi:ABC transporter permease [Aureimonas sp. AU40]|uniref:ABC transporter permease n=1 Tax=Aureimonas sp. AU40 TaxID=1637747 RepID=UPI000785519E|nr:ABC transporter permease subunit [Aureimonas sp. AU40]